MTISVIIPIYGRVELLGPCLKALCHQTLLPTEIIVVDDGNNEPTAEAIKNICTAYSAKYLRASPQGGASAARNRGMRTAEGDALFFCDADVVLLPHALEWLSSALENNSAALFAYGDYALGKRIMRGQKFNPTVLRDHNYISTMSLVRRSAGVFFDEKLKRFQDWDMWLTIAAGGGTGVYVPELLFHAQPNGTMSRWLPSGCVKNAKWFWWLPAVRAYISARKILFEKHFGDRSVQK